MKIKKGSIFGLRQGCIHGEDLPYIFGAPLIGGFNQFPRNYTKSEISLSEAVMLYWSNFVKSGNPNEPPEPEHGGRQERNRFKNIEWTPYESVHKKYLNLDTKPKLKNHYRAHRLSFWLNLVPDLHKPGSDDVPSSHHQLEDDEPSIPEVTVKPLNPPLKREPQPANGGPEIILKGTGEELIEESAVPTNEADINEIHLIDDTSATAKLPDTVHVPEASDDKPSKAVNEKTTANVHQKVVKNVSFEDEDVHSATSTEVPEVPPRVDLNNRERRRRMRMEQNARSSNTINPSNIDIISKKDKRHCSGITTNGLFGPEGTCKCSILI